MFAGFFGEDKDGIIRLDQRIGIGRQRYASAQRRAAGLCRKLALPAGFDEQLFQARRQIFRARVARS